MQQPPSQSFVSSTPVTTSNVYLAPTTTNVSIKSLLKLPLSTYGEFVSNSFNRSFSSPEPNKKTSLSLSRMYNPNVVNNKQHEILLHHHSQL